MGSDQALELMNRLLWASLVTAAPLLLATLAVGLVIGILQVTTQLQEMTLSYVPKLAVAALILIALGPWMIGQITRFAIGAIRTIPSLG